MTATDAWAGAGIGPEVDAGIGAGLAADLPVAALDGLRVVVVGTGLIGTSAALALRRVGADVALTDRDEHRVAVAADRGAGRPWAPSETADHVLLAVPPREVAPALARWQGELPAATFSDTSSVQGFTAREAAARGCRLDLMCGSHPVAGRERSGPTAADAGLFAGRPWIVTPSRAPGPTALARARLVGRGCGAQVTQMSADDHDRIMALVSHLPQVVASAMAARLAGAPGDAVRLAGPGVRDLTRIAGSDPQLWQEILTANATYLEPLLAALLADLEQVRTLLVACGAPEPAADVGSPPAADAPGLGWVLEMGNYGRSRLDVPDRGAAAADGPPADVVARSGG